MKVCARVVTIPRPEGKVSTSNQEGSLEKAVPGEINIPCAGREHGAAFPELANELLDQGTMDRKILVTGGAGFIGSHLADELLEHGYSVRAFDNLSEQVHGPGGNRPDYLDTEVELVRGDVRDMRALRKALDGVEAVFHFAALVGVGQSMYRVKEYTEVNNGGTANLMTALLEHPVEKVIVASSMSVYGEGLYIDITGEPHMQCGRAIGDLKRGRWELYDRFRRPLIPVPTGEEKTPSLSSVYALSKYDQERMCMIMGQAYHIPTVALRFFNVFGTRQALSNPYTGVLAIFASRLLNDRPPVIYEDGAQLRDFVNVRDVARACRLALEKQDANGEIFNVGRGEKSTIGEISRKLAAVMNKSEIEPEITGSYRMGDIRHCFSDCSKARTVLGYRPQVDFEKGLREFAEWLAGRMALDRVYEARMELASRGLTV